MMAVAAMAFVACNDPVKKTGNTADNNTTEQTIEQASDGTQNTQGQPNADNNGNVTNNANPSNAKATQSAEKKLPVPSEAEMKKLGLTGDMDKDVAIVVKAIVAGSNALREGKDPKEVDKATQHLLEAASGYYKSKGKLDEFNEKRDEVMREELTKELAKQKK